MDNLLRMMRLVRWHCPPDTGFKIRPLAVWVRARYLSFTEAVYWYITYRVPSRSFFLIISTLLPKQSCITKHWCWHIIGQMLFQHTFFGVIPLGIPQITPLHNYNNASVSNISTKEGLKVNMGYCFAFLRIYFRSSVELMWRTFQGQTGTKHKHIYFVANNPMRDAGQFQNKYLSISWSCTN